MADSGVYSFEYEPGSTNKRQPFSWISFFIGLLVGMIIILVIIWITYATKTFLFSYCAGNPTFCKGDDYYNDPGDALTQGAQLDDILFLNDINEMFYRRLPRNSSCAPTNDQTVVIDNPQYCNFTGPSGTVEGKSLQFNTPIYRLPNGSTITSDGNCVPSGGSGFTSGVPELKWDPNPLT